MARLIFRFWIHFFINFIFTHIPVYLGIKYCGCKHWAMIQRFRSWFHPSISANEPSSRNEKSKSETGCNIKQILILFFMFLKHTFRKYYTHIPVHRGVKYHGWTNWAMIQRLPSGFHPSIYQVTNREKE